jgi:hypothetical protein
LQIALGTEAKGANKVANASRSDLCSLATLSQDFGHGIRNLPDGELATVLIVVAVFEDGFEDQALRIDPVVRCQEFLLTQEQVSYTSLEIGRTYEA